MTWAVKAPFIRKIIDERLPPLARAYRWSRDAVRLMRSRPEPSGLGFLMHRGTEFSNLLVGAELSSFQEALQDADLFVDVGANVGFFSLIASRRNIRTLAIEPSPSNLKHLYENLCLSAGGGIVEVFPLAVSNVVGLAKLLGTGQLASLETGWAGQASAYRTTVPLTTLDTLLIGRQGRMLIKVDVEGHEVKLLRGSIKTLCRDPKPLWLIEHGPEVAQDYLEFFEIMWSNGYSLIALPETAERVPFAVDRTIVQAWSGMKCASEEIFLCKPLAMG